MLFPVLLNVLPSHSRPALERMVVDTLYPQDTSENGWIEHRASDIKELKGFLGGLG